MAPSSTAVTVPGGGGDDDDDDVAPLSPLAVASRADDPPTHLLGRHLGRGVRTLGLAVGAALAMAAVVLVPPALLVASFVLWGVVAFVYHQDPRYPSY